MELLARRFLLRDFTADDVQVFIAYRVDARYARLSAPEECTPRRSEHLLNWFWDWAGQQPRQNYELAVVQLRGPFALVGCAGLRGAGLPDGTAELGMELSPVRISRPA